MLTLQRVTMECVGMERYNTMEHFNVLTWHIVECKQIGKRVPLAHLVCDKQTKLTAKTTHPPITKWKSLLGECGCKIYYAK